MQRDPVRPAFAAALACWQLGYYSPEDSAKTILGFEELVALTPETNTLRGGPQVAVSLGSAPNSVLQVDTTKIPGALLKLPISFMSELDGLGEEFPLLVIAEKQRIDGLVIGESPASGWDDAG